MLIKRKEIMKSNEELEKEELSLYSYKNLYYSATQQIELLLEMLVKRDKQIKELKETNATKNRN